MSQVEEAVNQVVPENVEEDVPKYLKDRRRRQFLADMAAQYPQGTFVQISRVCEKTCGNNFKTKSQNYSVFLFVSFGWLLGSAIQTRPCLWQACRIWMRARSVLLWVLYQARGKSKKMPHHPHQQSF